MGNFPDSLGRDVPQKPTKHGPFVYGNHSTKVKVELTLQWTLWHPSVSVQLFPYIPTLLLIIMWPPRSLPDQSEFFETDLRC